MKKTTLAAGVALIALVLFINLEDEHQLSFNTIKNTLFNSTNHSEMYDQGASEQLENINSAKSENPNSLTDSELTTWIKNEALQLDKTVNDDNDIQIRIKQKASLLKPDQVEKLKDIILNSSLSINERIFSNYVLTLTFTPEAESMMNLIINTTDSFSKEKPLAHSEQELKRNQEYALRFTLIDEIIARMKNNGQSPLDYLIGLSKKTNDSQIKLYALQKAKSLSKNF